MHKTIRIAAVALVALLAPAAIAAQDAPARNAEALQIQQRLMQAQQQIMNDPEVQAAQGELFQALAAAMERIDPELEQKAERGAALQQEAAAAREAEDEERFAALAAEAQQLEAYFAAMRERAMEDPEMEPIMTGFQQLVIAKMTEVDPETPELLARLEELESEDS